MKKVKFEIIEGGIFKDERGVITFVNDFRFKNIIRFYMIENKDVNLIRAWQGHKYESKCFFAVQGSFSISLIEVDNWQNPSPSLKPISFELNSNKSQVLMVSGGYANGIKSLEEDSKLMVFSDFSLEQSNQDSYKFKSDKWAFDSKLK